MAQHRKTPAFLRIVASNQMVMCINPLQLSSFSILEKSKITLKDKTVIEGATIHFYFPSGTGIDFTVGHNITQEEFDYVCSTLLEFLYLNEAEWKAKNAAIAATQVAEWNKISEENEQKHEANQEPK